MTDINAIKARLRDAYCGSGDYDAALSEASNDVAALCDEVERLRGENEISPSCNKEAWQNSRRVFWKGSFWR